MRSPFTETVTVYNHTVENRTEVWRRTVIRGVQWTGRRVNAFDSNGQSVFQQEISLTIPVDADTGGKQYADPKGYNKSADKSMLWTLDPASGDDVIVYGECPAEISEDYTLGKLARDYIMVTIMAVSDNTRRARLRTWKVSCV